MHNMPNYMTNNMQNMQKCWEGLLQSYRSYFAYICTPVFADAGPVTVENLKKKSNTGSRDSAPGPGPGHWPAEAMN